MKTSLLFVFLLFLQYSVQEFGDLKVYSKHDLAEEEPTMIFIYYDSPENRCMACESYKKWLGTFKDGSVGVFKIKTLNFNTDPILALRFKATSFPTFFLQHKDRFKNITAVDVFGHSIPYDKKYENDIDAVLKNPRILDSVETIEGLFAPSSKLLLVYAHIFTWAMIIISTLDRISEAIPMSTMLLGICIIGMATLLIKKKEPSKHKEKED